MKPHTETSADDSLRRLAEAAGLAVHWRDAFNAPQEVNDDVLRSLLATMGLAADSSVQIRESMKRLEQDAREQSDHLIVMDQGVAAQFNWSGPPSYRITLESGRTLGGLATPIGPDMARIAPLNEVGYHVLEIGGTRRMLAVCPARCPSVAQKMGRKQGARPPWGVAAQIYSLRGGLAGRGGDYTLLGRLAEEAARHGAAAVAISPVHAMFSAAPSRYSPYSPSNRLFLNAAYIDPDRILGTVATCDVGQAQRRDQHDSDAARHVDWEKEQPQRLQRLRQAYDTLRRQGAPSLVAEMQAYRDREGAALRLHALFEALHGHHMPDLGPEHGWRDWPPALRDPDSAAVADFARRHAEEVDFHVFLQWQAHRGMQAAQQHALDAGMPIGLIADLAIGTDPRGSHAWSSQAEILPGVSLGAPPDIYQAQGQNWGLTAMSPRALRIGRYASFIALLRAAFAVSGGLRMDHILGLMRMWVIAPGAPAVDGAYLRYPVDDMLRLLTLEAWRHHAIVVGENLGTVPEGLNDKLAARGVLGMNVLWFQRQDQDAGQGGEAGAAAFLPPSDWPATAISMTTTHDLPTVAGWWAGRDLFWHERLSPPDAKPDSVAAAALRQEEKEALWAGVQATKCGVQVDDAVADNVRHGDVAAAPQTLHGESTEREPPLAAPIASILCYAASAPCPLFIAPLEDLLGMEEQPNLPGGHKDYPSWTQLLPLPVDAIFKDDAVLCRIAAIERGRGAS